MVALFNRNGLPHIVAFSIEQIVQLFKDSCTNEGITLSPLFKIEPDVQLYFIILDCSLQMLLGYNAHKLIPILEERGAKNDVHDIFFWSATELFNLYKNSAITPASTDWNALIR